MSRIVSLLFLLTSYYCTGQTVKFQIRRVTPCDKEGKIDSFNYFLIGYKGSVYYNESGIFILPKAGKYMIFSHSEPGTAFPTVDITEEGPFIYTIYEPRIVRRRYGMHGGYIYEMCGKAINGFEQDFYPNGNPKIRGNFIDGKPKDSLVTFYPSGITQRRVTYLAKKIVIEVYDSLANLESVSHNSNRSYYRTDYQTTEYYPNGKIRLRESSKDRLVKIEEYYANGQLKIVQTKKSRKEYHENGNEKVIYSWKRKKQKLFRGNYNFDFTIIKKVFDETGLLLEVQVYEYWGLYQGQPKLEFSKSNWIKKWTKRENGKEILIVRDTASKEYFNNTNQEK